MYIIQSAARPNANNLINISTLEVVSFNAVMRNAKLWREGNDEAMEELIETLTGSPDWTDEIIDEFLEFVIDDKKEFHGWVNEEWLLARIRGLQPT